MIRNDEQWLSLIETFQCAACGAESWETALHGFADATGSRSAQLTGIVSNTALSFNILTNADPKLSEIVAETVSINPRVKPASEAPVLKVIAEADFITPEDWRNHRFYQEIALPWDSPFIAMATLERQQNALIVVATIRSARDGHITPQQRETFAALAPHIRSAVRTQIALEGHGATVLTAAMDTLSIPIFVCDRKGRVGSLTQAAEALITNERGLQLKDGHLRACGAEDAKALSDAIEAAVIWRAHPSLPVLRTVIIRGRDHDVSPLVLDVFPLPSRTNQFTFMPRALVVARWPRGSKTRRAAILRATYALTSAETHIAEFLAQGQSAEFIAAKRGVAVETVRTQIKAIMAKLGISRQVELVVRLGEL
jgi:DNA-binding CsgD family transcriptional regulator